MRGIPIAYFVSFLIMAMSLLTMIEANGSIQIDFMYLTNNSDLRAYWSFDENSGDTVYDLSDNANHGVFASDSSETFPWRYPQRTGNSLYGRGLKFEEQESEQGIYGNNMHVLPPDGHRWVEVENTGNSLDIIGVENFYLDTWIFPYSYTDASMTEVTGLGGNEEVVDCSVSNVIISKITADLFVDQIAPGSFQLGFNHTGSGQVEFRLYETNRYNPPIQLISPDPLSTYNWHRITVTGTYSFFPGQSSYYYLNLFIDGICVDSTYTTLFNRQENSDMVTIGADPRSYALIKDNDNYRMQERYAQFYGIIDHILFSYKSPYQQNFIGGEHLHVGEIIGKYDFDEGAGHLAHDQSIYDRTIDINDLDAAPDWSWDERWGHCLEFDGDDKCVIENSSEFETDQYGGGVGVGLKLKLYELPDDGNPFSEAHALIIGKVTLKWDQQIGHSYTWALSISEYGKIKYSSTYQTINGPLTTTLVSSSTFGNYHDEWIEIFGYSNGKNLMSLYINGICEASTGLQGSGLIYSGIVRNIYLGKEHFAYGSTVYGFEGLLDDLVISRNHIMNQVSECGYFDLDTVQFDSQNNESYVVDKSSFDHRLMKDGSATSALNGAFGNCLSFNAQTSDVWRIEEYDIIDLSDSFTIELWLNLTLEGSPRTLISQASDVENTRRGFVLGTNISGHPYFSIYDETSSQTLTVISPVDLLPDNVYLGNWHHVMARFIDRGGENGVDEISLHVDGYLDPDCVLRQTNIVIETSTQPILLGGSKGKDDSDPSNVFNGTLDELRFCQGIRTLYEDFDNDGMSDINEIMRSTMSDQYHPYRHNSRFAIIASAVVYRQPGGPDYQSVSYPPTSEWQSYYSNNGTMETFSEDTLYQYSGDEMYKALRELNYQDEDILYLTSYNDTDNSFYPDFTWDVSYQGTHYHFLLSEFLGEENAPLYLLERSSHRFPIDGLLTYDNIRSGISGLGTGGQINILDAFHPIYRHYNEVTLTKLDELDNLFVFYVDHGGNGLPCWQSPFTEDSQGEPNYNNDNVFNGGDEFIKTFSVFEGNTNKLMAPGVPNGTRYICAMKEVEYFDDQMRYDLDQIDDVRYMTIMIHACHSGGFIEDLQHDSPNRILISSCGETESSTICGPLFCEWLNERTLDNDRFPPLDDPHNTILNADRNIRNEPIQSLPYLRKSVKLEDINLVGNHDNNIISLQEMYINSVYSSKVHSHYYYPNDPTYKPIIIIGDICYEQIYL